jgi:hypothetical protein
MRPAGELTDGFDAFPGQHQRLPRKAIEESAGGGDVERGGLLVVERAQALERAATGVLQLQVLTDHLVDGGALAYRCDVLVADPPRHRPPPPPSGHQGSPADPGLPSWRV